MDLHIAKKFQRALILDFEELEYLALFFNLWYTVPSTQAAAARLPTKLRFFSLFFVYKIESFIVFWAERERKLSISCALLQTVVVKWLMAD